MLVLREERSTEPPANVPSSHNINNQPKQQPLNSTLARAPGAGSISTSARLRDDPAPRFDPNARTAPQSQASLVAPVYHSYTAPPNIGWVCLLDLHLFLGECEFYKCVLVQSLYDFLVKCVGVVMNGWCVIFKYKYIFIWVAFTRCGHLPY